MSDTAKEMYGQMWYYDGMVYIIGYDNSSSPPVYKFQDGPWLLTGFSGYEYHSHVFYGEASLQQLREKGIYICQFKDIINSIVKTIQENESK